ncbi:hypothetical protein GYMLUDRAFT_35811 [Collybiopsis luxurians FD-317 M1]|nr:hypothetical protein GYMLUDRAFT_35811 [Collybiopsis luxurians FD-317 M1]
MPGVDLLSTSASARSDSRLTRNIRSLPQTLPSERLRFHQQSRMQVGVPEWQGTLLGSIKISKTHIIGEAFDHIALAERRPDASELTPKIVLKPGSGPRLSRSYHLFAATERVTDMYESKKALKNVLEKNSRLSRFKQLVFCHLLVELGVEMMDRVQGPHFTFIDPLCAIPKNPERVQGPEATDIFTTSPEEETSRTVKNIIEHAKRLLSVFLKAGIEGNRVVIGIPATQPGVIAAAQLEAQFSIRTNLYLVSGLMHAIACAEANPTCITVDVGVILSWHEKSDMQDVFVNWVNLTAEDLVNHPGVIAILSILRYYKLHAIKTTVVGKNFRSAHEVSLLAQEFDMLSLSPSMMSTLSESRLRLCVPGFSPAKPAYFDPQSTRSHSLQSPADSEGSHLARAAPPFPTSIIRKQCQNPDSSLPPVWNFEWTHSEVFFNRPTMREGSPSPHPFILLSTIVFDSCKLLRTHMHVIHGAISKIVRRKFHARVLPDRVLYRGSRDDVWKEIYAPKEAEEEEAVTETEEASPASETEAEIENPPRGLVPTIPSRPRLTRQDSFRALGNGHPSTSTAPIYSPSPRRPSFTSAHAPSPRRPSTRRSSSTQATSRTLIRTPSLSATEMATATAPGGYASDDEIDNIIALTLGEPTGGKTASKGKMQAKPELAKLKHKTLAPFLPGLSRAKKAKIASASQPSMPGPSGVPKEQGKGQGQAQRQVLAFTVLLNQREEAKKTKAPKGGEPQDHQPMVEDVDFF